MGGKRYQSTKRRGFPAKSTSGRQDILAPAGASLDRRSQRLEGEYQGFDLPAQYQGDPAALAADWDVIILCGFRMPWDTDWSSEIAAFVATHGKGFLGVMDYEGVVVQADFDNISTITSQAGIVFDPLNLEWAPASAEVSLDCVPDVPPPPR